MSLQFTSDARPPSNTQLLPNRFLRPAFGELYGFDADADSGSAAPPYSNTYSALLDGTDEAIETTYSPTVGSTAFTATMWIKSSNTTTSQGFISNYNGSSYNLNVISPYTTKSFYVIINNGTSQSVINGIGGQDSTLDIRDGNWHHLAITVNGTSVKIYKDGGDAAINTSNPTNTQGTPFGTWTSGSSYIGVAQNFWFGTNGSLSYSSGNRYYLDGNIDEAAVWESELSGSDISAIYNSGLPNDISSYSPVGYWRMGDNDSGTGTTITDQGSGGNDATLDNGASFSTDVPLAPLVLPSITNTYSLNFDGSNDYVDTGIPTDLQGSATMSLSFWFKSDTSGVGPSIGCRSGSANQWGFLRAGSLNYVQIITGSNGKYFSYSSPSDTNYHHYVITFNAGTIEFFLDGSPVSVSFTNSGNGTAATLHSDSVSFDIGRNQSFYSDGLMDEVSLFDKVLSQREITAMYNSGVPNDISSLNPVGWWRNGDNDSGTGTTITDQGSGGNNGTLINGPTFSTNVPLAPLVLPSITNTYSVDFDGTNDYFTADAGSALRSTSAISISQWINLDSIGGTQKPFSLGNTSSLDDRVQYYVNYLGIVTAYVKLVGTAKSGNSVSTLSASSWNHIVITLDNTNGLNIYINGTHERTIAVSAGFLSNNSNLLQVRMSARATSLSQFVNGKIDETSVFDTTLSQRDITAIYNNGVPNDISSLNPVHWWRSGDNDGGTGTTITDQGSASNDGTLVNGPTFSTNVPS